MHRTSGPQRAATSPPTCANTSQPRRTQRRRSADVTPRSGPTWADIAETAQAENRERALIRAIDLPPDVIAERVRAHLDASPRPGGGFAPWRTALARELLCAYPLRGAPWFGGCWRDAECRRVARALVDLIDAAEVPEPPPHLADVRAELGALRKYLAAPTAGVDGGPQ